MYKYILRKGNETIEVPLGNEFRRDKLISAGYAWVNRDQFPKELNELRKVVQRG